MNLFSGFYRSGADWFPVGLSSSFPDLGDDDDIISAPRTCNDKAKPGCKVFQVPTTDSTQASEVEVSEDSINAYEGDGELKTQVLVFQYRGKFHAIDHQCPHSSFPLSKGTPFDIEDFGVVLSAGLTCPKHGWSFDLFHGTSDRGHYKLKVWEVQLRDIKGAVPPILSGEADSSEKPDKEVWVRRKQRMG
ncbi:Rieske domain-containing protein [Dactylonectria estremocensis]|uniref:Rieske domain-containing protein n=1 Tax=Dactylonectria estremocensis TaxID=1079267 RepID=A0A9P9EZU4_9HYPO|nr:Rieske domain-containing protein [Dactylonectria estremocensis]